VEDFDGFVEGQVEGCKGLAESGEVDGSRREMF
jgi:hypothetical protein